ncbi:MAG: DNA repair protein RadC [Paludibacter sp.]|nr:DNA repair protein RadC [Paludibacter sp.]
MSLEGKHLTIREWSEEDRPREKMLQKGAVALSDAELLAILIASGNRNESAVDVAKRILAACHHNLNELARKSVRDLTREFKGIGDAKALSIVASLELGKRRNTRDAVVRPKITSSANLQSVFEPLLIDLLHEEFWVAYMDNGNNVMEVRKLTQGGMQHTVVDVPMLLKNALERSSVCVAVAHNHPSGQNFPSREDEKVTQRIKSGCEAVGIRLLDHIIIARGNYYSFCDEGKL